MTIEFLGYPGLRYVTQNAKLDGKPVATRAMYAFTPRAIILEERTIAGGSYFQ